MRKVRLRNLCVNGGFAVVRHQSNERSVPLIRDLGERSGPTAHQNLPNAVLKRLHGFVTHPQECLHDVILRYITLTLLELHRVRFIAFR